MGTSCSKNLVAMSISSLVLKIHRANSIIWLGVPPTLTGMANNGGGFTNNFISLKTLVEDFNMVEIKSDSRRKN